MLGKGKMAQQADFIDKVVVVTGGAQGIGRCISEEFRKAGAQVCVIDKQEGDHNEYEDKKITLETCRDCRPPTSSLARGRCFIRIS